MRLFVIALMLVCGMYVNGQPAVGNPFGNPIRGGGGGSSTGGITLLQATGVVNGIIISSNLIDATTGTNIGNATAKANIANSNLSAFNQSVPISHILNFRSLTNQQPFIGILGYDGQYYSPIDGVNGVGTNQTAITNGAWTVLFNQSSNFGNHIGTTNLYPTDYQYVIMNYSNFNSSAVTYPGSYFLCSTQAFGSSGGFDNMFHITIINDTITLELWTNTIHGTLGSVVMSRGPDVGGVNFLLGYFFGNNTITFFGSYIPSGFATITNAAINNYKPVAGRPSYMSWEQYQLSQATNVLWNINFVGLGCGNFQSLNQRMPDWIRDYIEPVQFQLSAQGYSTLYGDYSGATLSSRGAADMLRASNSATASFVVRSNGWAGVNTTTPTNSLDVNGNASVRSNLFVSLDLNVSRSITVAQSTGFTNPPFIVLGTNGQTVFWVRTNTASGASVVAIGTNLNNAMVISNFNGMTYFMSSNAAPAITINGGNGNVGFNNPTPSNAVDVVGNLMVRGNQTNSGSLSVSSGITGGGYSGGNVTGNPYLRGGSYIGISGIFDLSSGGNGMMRLTRDSQAAGAMAILLEGNTDASPSIANTNGDVLISSAGSPFSQSKTNRLLVPGGIVAGTITGNGSGITNIGLSASATLDFPSTAAGAVSDLQITVTGAISGDPVVLGVPPGSISTLTGGYLAFASNDVVYVRFVNNNLVSAQDPASGSFKVRVLR